MEYIIKISIFPKAKGLPKNKAEKNYESKFASRPHLPEVVEVNTEDELIAIVTKYVWSPSIFKKARLQEDFVSTDFLVLDIDSNLTIDEAYQRVEEASVTCLCAPSTSHTPDKQRFRLIFPLAKTITKVDDFLASMEDLTESFPEADPIVKSNFCAFYFASTLDDGFWLEGDMLEPVLAKVQEAPKYSTNDGNSTIKVDMSIDEIVTELYGEKREFIPEAVDHFLKNAHTGLPGTWNSSLNRCVFVLSLQGVEEDVIMDLMEHLAPYDLDKSDLATIRHSYRDGEKFREY